MKFGDFVKIKSLGTPAGFRDNLAALGLDMPCDDEVLDATRSPLAQPLTVDGLSVGNRFAIQPMEGWDGGTDGLPSENTRRRWRHFGLSGAKFIWGGEAVAVRPDGRANPHQLMLHDDATMAGIATLRDDLLAAHREAMGRTDGLVVGLQLTHSGRFARPNSKTLEPAILFHHPLLDRKFGTAPDHPPMSDGEIRRLIDDYVAAAKRAHALGFDFVDLKCCHGYLGHEFLAAKTRPGDFGGSLENRMRFLRETIAGIRAEAPGLKFGIRLSAADFVPFKPDPALSGPDHLGPGVPEAFDAPYRHGFGHDEHDPLKLDLAEPIAFMRAAQALGVQMFNTTLGSPYYNPHMTRPALYPPSDGYQPPEDPLIGVMRHLQVTRDLKAAVPGVVVMGSGYTYLQEFLPQVAQAVVRAGWADLVGLGRMVLAYPELPADVLAGRGMARKRLCRTFSDCTTAPRNGLVSGCYPLDAHYKKSPAMATLTLVKKAANLA